MADGTKARAPRIDGRPIASAVTLYTADLTAVAGVLDRQQYQAFVMMCVDFQVYGAEPAAEAVEGFEDAYRWFFLLRPYAEGTRDYTLAQDARALAEGMTIDQVYGEGIAEWYEG